MNPDQANRISSSEEFCLDQPWNPVSYFEEEDEATGIIEVYNQLL